MLFFEPLEKKRPDGFFNGVLLTSRLALVAMKERREELADLLAFPVMRSANVRLKTRGLSGLRMCAKAPQIARLWPRAWRRIKRKSGRFFMSEMRMRDQPSGNP
jgi:hypothetical protein